MTKAQHNADRQTDQPQPVQESSPEPNTVLVLQGGGALGAYQAGAYQALSEGGYTPNWVAGISIGSINAAIIAGNPPEQRVEKLRTFWEGITASLNLSAPDGDLPRRWFNACNAWAVMMFGVPGFFEPRVPLPYLRFRGATGATSFYDTEPLRETLEAVVDFERINAGHTRLSLGAVNIETGNFTYFDNEQQRIGPEHVMASCALPPGFPPVEIDGAFYWDGGVVSNAPLSHVLQWSKVENLLIFQVDLWSARGVMPRNLVEVEDRRKEINYSSRTRTVTDAYQRELKLRQAIARLTERLPEDARQDPALQDCLALGERRRVNIVHRVEDFSFDDWKKLTSIHLDGAFLTTKACIKHMYQQNSGVLLYMGSVHSKEASALKSAYVTAKHGILGLARVMSIEGAKYGVRSNVICPGFVETPLVKKQIPEQAENLGISEQEVRDEVMLGGTVDKKFTQTSDIAELALFLAAFPTNALTGQSVVASHGWFMN